MFLTFLIKSKHQLNNLIQFDILQQFNSPNLMSINHIFQNPSHLICTISTLNIICVALGMPRDLPNVIISCSLQNKTNRKVWIVVFFFETSFNKPCLTADGADLLAS